MLTQKLCGFNNKYQIDQNLRLVVLMRNPVVRVVQNYQVLSKQKPWITFKRYLTSKFFKDNLFTRTLICKPKDDLTEKDLEAAKLILKESVLATFDNIFGDVYLGAFTKQEDKQGQCIKDNMLEQSFLDDSEELLKDHEDVLMIRDRNKIDMKLYLYALSLTEL